MKVKVHGRRVQRVLKIARVMNRGRCAGCWGSPITEDPVRLRLRHDGERLSERSCLKLQGTCKCNFFSAHDHFSKFSEPQKERQNARHELGVRPNKCEEAEAKQPAEHSTYMDLSLGWTSARSMYFCVPLKIKIVTKECTSPDLRLKEDRIIKSSL